MALHLTLEKGDKVILSDGVVLDVRRTGAQTQISIEAPAEIKIMPVFKDSKKQMRYGFKDE
jgi:sRNA-binding carbon storage regulator CsrA